MIRQAKILFLLVVMLKLVGGFEPGLAYSQESNYKFYPHNYAGNPMDSSNAEPGSTASPNSNNIIDPKSTNNTNPSNIIPAIEPSGKAIESISLIANNLDFAELQRCADILLKIYNEKTVRPSTLFLLGVPSKNYPADLKNRFDRLGMLGVNQVGSDQSPTNFKVKKVPSWILTTKEGDIVLEGLNSPEKLINSKGEFIDPHDLQEAEEVPGTDSVGPR